MTLKAIFLFLFYVWNMLVSIFSKNNIQNWETYSMIKLINLKDIIKSKTIFDDKKASICKFFKYLNLTFPFHV